MWNSGRSENPRGVGAGPLMCQLPFVTGGGCPKVQNSLELTAGVQAEWTQGPDRPQANRQVLTVASRAQGAVYKRAGHQHVTPIPANPQSLPSHLSLSKPEKHSPSTAARPVLSFL